MAIMQEAGKSLVDVFIIPPKSVNVVWEPVLAIMKKYDGGVFRFTEFELVKKMLEEDKLELWIGVDDRDIELAALTQVCGTKERYVELFWLGGQHFEKYRDVGLEKMEKWAAKVGASSLVVGGRKGWTRKLKAKGFSFHRIEMIKPVSYAIDRNTGKYSWRH